MRRPRVLDPEPALLEAQGFRPQRIADGERRAAPAPRAASSFVFVNGLINIVPDGIPFVRGNSNGDVGVNLSDAVFTLDFLFRGSGDPPCADAADANDDGGIDIADPVATLNWLFAGTVSIPPPFGSPGLDPTADGLGCATGA